MAAADPASLKDSIHDAAVIAVMGMTGAGKSTFVQKATGLPDDVVGVGTDLASYTQEPQMHVFRHEFKDIVLVDTPGFDDSLRTDADVLELVADFFALIYTQKVRFSGIIYLHDITKNRIGHGGTANLKLFKALCGEDPLPNVVLATTRWDVLKDEAQPTAVHFENLLSTDTKYWSDMVKGGSRIFRFMNSKDSALEIINFLVAKQSKVTLQIQEELVDRGTALANTAAGGTLNLELEKRQLELEEKVKRQTEEINRAHEKHDKEMEDLKRNQLKRTEELLQQFRDQQQTLHVDHGDRIRQYEMKMRQLQMQIEDNEAQKASLEGEMNLLQQKSKAPPNEIQSKQKKPETTKAKIEWVEIGKATATTALAAGLSVINPSAIPVAIDGFVKLINAIFRRKTIALADGDGASKANEDQAATAGNISDVTQAT